MRVKLFEHFESLSESGNTRNSLRSVDTNI
jgi:hypothetical protein